MPDLYEVTVTAVGEVRDADGRLISQEPVTGVSHVTADQIRHLPYADLKQLGLTPDQINTLKGDLS